MTATGSTTADGSSTTEQAKEKAQQTAQEAAGKARGAVLTQVDQRSTEAGERASGLAQDVRSVGEQLREQGKDQPAKLAEQAADRAERLGDYLTRSDADTILGDLEDFGRRQPWTVVAGGLAVGFIASRFLKASSSRRSEARWESSNRLPARRQDVTPPPAPGLTTGTVPITPGAPAPDVSLSGGVLPGGGSGGVR